MPKPKPPAFYAVHRGRTPGVYPTWPACQAQVKGASGAVFKKFATRAEAETFVQYGRNGPPSSSGSGQAKAPPSAAAAPPKTPPASPRRRPSKRARPAAAAAPAWPFAPPPGFVPDHTVYTDGGYRRVQGAGGASKPKKLASMGVYFGPDDPRNVSARVGPEHTGGCKKQTNNVGELCAILEALRLLDAEVYTKGQRVLVGTDSQYAIRCATTYGAKCAPGGVKANDASVPNRALVLALHAKVVAAEGRVQFLHVPAHTTGQDAHSVGNRAADALATGALVG